MHCSRECTLSYLSTGISNLLQLAQAEVVLVQHSSICKSSNFTVTCISILSRASYSQRVGGFFYRNVYCLRHFAPFFSEHAGFYFYNRVEVFDGTRNIYVDCFFKPDRR